MSLSQDQINRIFSEYYRALIWRWLGVWKVAVSYREDVYQDVFLTIWQRRDTFKDEGKLVGWLRKVALNCVRDDFRRRGRANRKISEYAQAPPVNDERGPDEHVLAYEAVQCLQAFLDTLDVEDAELVQLHYIEGMPTTTAAKLLGIKADAAFGRLRRLERRYEEFVLRGGIDERPRS